MEYTYTQEPQGKKRRKICMDGSLSQMTQLPSNEERPSSSTTPNQGTRPLDLDQVALQFTLHNDGDNAPTLFTDILRQFRVKNFNPDSCVLAFKYSYTEFWEALKKKNKGITEDHLIYWSRDLYTPAVANKPKWPITNENQWISAILQWSRDREIDLPKTGPLPGLSTITIIIVPPSKSSVGDAESTVGHEKYWNAGSVALSRASDPIGSSAHAAPTGIDTGEPSEVEFSRMLVAASSRPISASVTGRQKEQGLLHCVLNDEQWRDCCIFFQHDVSKVANGDGVHLCYTHRALEPWEMKLVWWMLCRHQNDAAPGAVLHDEHPDGLTEPTLAFFTILAGLLRRQDRVKASRARDEAGQTSQQAALHLPEATRNNPQLHDATCPSQQANDVLCMCVDNSSSAALMRTTAGNMSIILTSSGHLGNWRQATQAFLTFDSPLGVLWASPKSEGGVTKLAFHSVLAPHASSLGETGAGQPWHTLLLCDYDHIQHLHLSRGLEVMAAGAAEVQLSPVDSLEVHATSSRPCQLGHIIFDQFQTFGVGGRSAVGEAVEDVEAFSGSAGDGNVPHVWAITQPLHEADLSTPEVHKGILKKDTSEGLDFLIRRSSHIDSHIASKTSFTTEPGQDLSIYDIYDRLLQAAKFQSSMVHVARMPATELEPYEKTIAALSSFIQRRSLYDTGFSPAVHILPGDERCDEVTTTPRDILEDVEREINKLQDELDKAIKPLNQDLGYQKGQAVSLVRGTESFYTLSIAASWPYVLKDRVIYEDLLGKLSNGDDIQDWPSSDRDTIDKVFKVNDKLDCLRGQLDYFISAGFPEMAREGSDFNSRMCILTTNIPSTRLLERWLRSEYSEDVNVVSTFQGVSKTEGDSRVRQIGDINTVTTGGHEKTVLVATLAAVNQMGRLSPAGVVVAFDFPSSPAALQHAYGVCVGDRGSDTIRRVAIRNMQNPAELLLNLDL